MRTPVWSMVLTLVACGGGTNQAAAPPQPVDGGRNDAVAAGGSAGSGAGALVAGSAFGGSAANEQPGAGPVSAAAASPGARPGFWVDGRFLRDRCGEKVILRGINEMIVWSPDKTGASAFAEIAKTSANSVRIVWTIKDGTPEGMDTAIGNAVKAGLVPIIELHDATGKWSELGSLVDYWTTPKVVSVLQKHAAHLLVNIGNEVGDDKVKGPEFFAGYKSAITRMRSAGLHMPLVIDAPHWGQNIDVLQSEGPKLVAADPDRNLLLSVHVWWPDGTATKIKNELRESVALNLPLIIGEFAQHSVWECSKHPIDYATLLAEAKAHEMGLLAWSWGQVKNKDCAGDGPFDMTADGTFATLVGWGKDVAVTDPNSIKNTSVKVASLAGGACR